MQYTFLQYKVALAVFHSQFFNFILSSEISEEDKNQGEVFDFESLNLRIPYEDEKIKDNVLYYINHPYGGSCYMESTGYKVTFERVPYDKQYFVATRKEYDKIDQELSEMITGMFINDELKSIDLLVESIFSIMSKMLNNSINIDDRDAFLSFFDIVEEVEYCKKDFFFKHSYKDFWGARAYEEKLFEFLGYLHFQPNSDELEEYLEYKKEKEESSKLSMRYMSIDENQGYDDYENPWQAIKYLSLEYKTYYIYPWYRGDTKEERIQTVHQLLSEMLDNDDLDLFIGFYSDYKYWIHVIKKGDIDYYDFHMEDE